ncbi:MAG: glycoside hydrolase family 16 protein [Fimbriimonadales bacterium]|nr:glycoside hydrolase family 16 protein [Fimbriimonadales bacterium]
MIALFALLTSQGEPWLPPTPERLEWRLTWSDEFEGDRLDETKWEVPEYKRRDAHWSRRAVEVREGRLRILTFRDPDGSYHDACVRTKGRFEHTYGFYVARIRLHRSPGHWPAFWLFNDSQGNLGEGGSNGAEIDILEKPWLDDRINMAIHWDGYGEHHRSAGREARLPGVMEGWHDFALEWSPKGYVFYADGRELWRTDAGGVCRVPLYLKLSDELQFGGWAGDPDPSRLPDWFDVDFVRVYDLVDRKTGRRVFPGHPTEIPRR